MNEDSDELTGAKESELDWVAIKVTVGSLLVLVLLGMLAIFVYPDSRGVFVAFLLAQAVVISIVIWQACDPFADAAQWIGKTYHIPGSVRGATLDAIASSMPELFTGIFFVVVVFIGRDAGIGKELAEEASVGFGAAIATCAGSAVYNMILIPAFCTLVIAFTRKERPTIDVSPEVITRDGVSFLACELVLIVFLFGDKMYWWMGLILLGLYAVYVTWLYTHARTHRRQKLASAQNDDEDSSEDENGSDYANVLFGWKSIQLRLPSVCVIIVLSTIVAAASCFWLVEVTKETATARNVPLFFVAVILAAAASSVPDTFLSIGAARRGDDSGAVSNAFGSNIFDICICLSIPLLVLTTWVGGPVALEIPGIVYLRILLLILTTTTLLIMWQGHQLSLWNAYVLCGLYIIFVSYAIWGSFTFSR